MVTQPYNTPNIGPFRKIRLKVNKQGYWEIWWTDASGGTYLTRRESTKSKIRTEAEAYLGVFCSDARDREAALVSVPTVDELCRRWLDYVSPKGADRTGRYVLATIRRVLGGYTVDQLSPDVLQDYTRQRRVADGTVRRELGALRTVLIRAAKQKLISRDEIPEFDESVMPPHGNPRTKFLDPGQEQWFWDQAMLWGDPARWITRREAQSARQVMIFTALGMETAARREAILDLTWDRVDLALGMIDYRVPGKRVTKKRRVRVPVSDRLIPVLKEAWLRAPKDPSGRAVGRVVGVIDIGRQFVRFTQAINMPWVTPHVLRHSWGSLKAMKGAPLYDIAQVMGDKIATIEANYLHLTPDHLRRVVNF